MVGRSDHRSTAARRPPARRCPSPIPRRCPAGATLQETPIPSEVDESAAVERIAAAVAASHQRADVPVSRQSRRGLRLLSVSVVALCPLFGGLAAAGALPAGVQSLTASVLSQVGVSIPNPGGVADQRAPITDNGKAKVGTDTAPGSGTNLGTATVSTPGTTEITNPTEPLGPTVTTDPAAPPDSPETPGNDPGNGNGQGNGQGNGNGQGDGNGQGNPPNLPDHAKPPSQANGGLSHRP